MAGIFVKFTLVVTIGLGKFSDNFLQNKCFGILIPKLLFELQISSETIPLRIGTITVVPPSSTFSISSFSSSFTFNQV